MITETVDNGTYLTLENVDWKGYYVVSRASIGQIMRTFQNVKEYAERQKNTVKPYEKELNNGLIILLPTLLTNFRNMLYFQNDIEKDIIYFNMLVNMPYDVSIDNEKYGRINLSRANIGSLIKAAKQRVNFILSRETPNRYKESVEQIAVFESMKLKLKEFVSDIDDFEQDFLNVIDKAHKTQQKHFGKKSNRKYYPKKNQVLSK